MGEQKEGIFRSEIKFDLEYFVNLEIEFLVPEEQREDGILTWDKFFRREAEKRVGLRIILSKRVNGKKGVGLRMIFFK